MRRLIIAAFFCASPALAADNVQAVIGSHHDFGVSGGGPVTSAVTDSCAFCHAPHNVLGGVTPLWDHQLSSQTYTTYTSSTYNAGPQAPSGGTSKLCLSCHDGTIAVGLTASKGSVTTSGSMSPEDVLGVNLSSGHPMSMVPVDDGQLAPSLFSNPPSTKDAAVKLVSGKIECTTCHDPHVPNKDSVVPMFLSRSNANGALCLACHDPTRAQPSALNGWTNGSHATASHSISPAAGAGEYGTVATNACSSCHAAHQNQAGARNLRAPEEAACSPCHGGISISPALPNVMSEFGKSYRHPTSTLSGLHDPTETLPLNASRHSECPDCHNSHSASNQVGTALPPALQASLAGVSGYDSGGAQRPAANEYQVCFKCHADSTNKPQNSTYSIFGRTVTRSPQGSMPAGYTTSPPMPSDQYNTRLQFMSTIGHNVMGNSVVTTSNSTLRTYMLNIDGTSNTSRPLSTSSRLYCTDCHDNDQARAFNGSGANGPHGSSFQHLLQLDFYIEPIGGGSGNTTAGRALCNKCHDLSNMSTLHRDHHNNFGCGTCHDPHGVIGGNPASNRAMINFDTAIVTPSSTYYGYYYNSSSQKGCYLRCHGENHSPGTY